MLLFTRSVRTKIDVANDGLVQRSLAATQMPDARRYAGRCSVRAPVLGPARPAALRGGRFLTGADLRATNNISTSQADLARAPHRQNGRARC